MKPLTLEWIEKAEGDYHTAQREFQVQDYPNYDAVCFHAQQCVEKYLKACLQENNVAFGKTHDLVVLADLLIPLEPAIETHRSQLRILSASAVEYRYPGEKADKELARQTLTVCEDMRQVLRQCLELTND
ncbi:MAG: hypothetical protein MAG431_01384 [Chloroflexi bacterium]|nr:hypothetical protein [Chloroflexota bacterium]